MVGASIPLPSARIPPMAGATAQRRKLVAAIMLAVAAVFAVAAVAFTFDHLGASHQEPYGTLFGMAFWVVLFGVLGMSLRAGARRIMRTGQLAASDPSYTWFLNGRHIVAVDSSGVPRPELSFKVSARLRMMLTEIPRAQVVTRGDS